MQHTRNPDLIPTSVVTPVLASALERFETWKQPQDDGSGGWRESLGSTLVADLVAARRGESRETWRRKMQRILRREYETASISTVDEFLVEMGQQHLWYTPPLSEYYFSEAILSMPEWECGDDLIYFACCSRWGTLKQKVKGQSRQCLSCRKKHRQWWNGKEQAA